MWLDPLLVCAAALCAGATLLVSPGAACLGLLGLSVLLFRRLSWRCRLGVAACLVLGALRGARSLAEFDQARIAARDGFGPPQRCGLTGTVATSPTWIGGRTVYVLKVLEGDCESSRIAAGSLVRLGGGLDDLARGDRLSVVAQLAPIELLFNLDLADPLPNAARRGVTLSGAALSVERDWRPSSVSSWIDRARASVRRRILQTFVGAAEPMARALVLGENDLDPEDDTAFRKSGLSHMLAVSGTHLVFAVVSLVHAVAALLVRVERLSAARDTGRWAALIGVPLALVYADFAGGSGSAWRAAYMLSAALLARFAGRSACPSRAFALSLAAGWLFDPLVAFDISFLLSAAATSGLLLLGRRLQKPCERFSSRFARLLGTAVATTIAAMIPCAPLLALLSSDLTLAGVLANVLAAPLGEAVALPLCLLHAISAAIPALESGIALVASGALLAVREIARESAAQRWLALPVPEPTGYHLALAAVLAVGMVLATAQREQRALGWFRWWLLSGTLGLCLIEWGARTHGHPSGQLRMTALAVGQGDATLIDLPDGRLMLIDGGGAPEGGPDPGARVILPALRARRRDRIDIVVLSHPHPDHFGGLLAVLGGVQVSELWDTGQGAVEGAGPVYAQMLQLARNKRVRIRTSAELCQANDLPLRVLAPCPSFQRGRSANDSSFVLRLQLGSRSLLLMGDAEHAEEDDLMRSQGSALASDVLKVGHHGSRTSSSEALLRAVSPHLASISCGVRNRFGHPVPELLARLRRLGIEFRRTDRDGALQVTTDGAELLLDNAYPGRSRAAIAWVSGLWR